MRWFHLSGLVAGGALLSLLPALTQERSPIDPKHNQAAKLAGLVGFVNQDCPALRGDPARLQQAVEALGVDMASLDRGELFLSANGYIAAYRKDVAGSCRKAEEIFGPNGSVIPGLVVPR